MLEKDYQKCLLRYLEGKGAYIVKTVVTTKAGVPDVLACYKGKFLGIEVKQPSKLKTLTPLQQFNLDAIKKAGGISLVYIGDNTELDRALEAL